MNKYKYIFLLLAPLTISFSNYSCKIIFVQWRWSWYANPTSLNNLIQFCQSNLNININPTYDVVDVESSEPFRYPFIHMTGHGNVVFSFSELKILEIICWWFFTY